MNNLEQYDVVVIGAGPSGALASSLLVQKGWRVLVLEQQAFPRFSIGESLLPQCMAYLEDAGLIDTLHNNAAALGFQFKDGAAFHRAGQNTTINFTEKFTKGPGTTYQVKRADFDKLLADKAQGQGVEIRYKHTVVDYCDEPNGASLVVYNEQQQAYRVNARFVLDASGFGRVLPKLLDLELPSNFPVRSAYFSHFKDNISDTSFDRNKILITVHPQYSDVWYWLIPFSDGTASIGVVAQSERFNDDESSDLLNQFIEQDPYLKTLLAQRELLTPAKNIKGYSANVSKLYGKHFALLGNAGEFLDPVFSSGVTIALKSANLVAPLVDRYLKNEVVDFDAHYAQPLQAGVDCFRTFVTGWYDTRFQDVIFYSEQNTQVREMISAILAGYAWDTNNPFVAQSERRLNVLAQLCQN
ncbi:NAD(P)/FAD-dependent oxidoreductase [Pseudoalteromonas sp. NSLLW24]|uniref:NAD(P)/FAD-dependent oxidoreductase n=1 Tax=Pseudoalteromonas sp. NSLLW24 TaxID=2792050 RepID=UPI0018CD536A|nr:NAD(P)/FAD-dependent oxidoreductase [Pseudoalteromonas sp. NSLLW24]MBH0000452.1 NAD(P)/FAD-dependent oxidoreductase [Pseudoalteromonas sp. NSLLW24]